MFKFRDQLLVTLLLVGLMPAVLILFETFGHNSNEVQDFSIELSENKLDAIVEGLANEFSEAEKYVALYARHPSIQSMQYQQFHPVLKAELEHLKPKYEKFIVGKPNGHFYNTSGGNLLQNGIRTFNDLSASSKPKSISTRDYWQATIKNNINSSALTYISNPMISYTTGAKQVVIASSVLNNTNELVGMVGISIDWERINIIINQLIEKHFSGKTPAKIMLVSGDGTYWYHWNKDKILKLVTDSSGEFLLNNSGEKAVQKSSILNEESKDLSVIGKDMVAGLSGTKVLEVDNKKYHIIYRPVQGTEYSVGLLLEDDIIMSPVYKVLNHYLFILGVCLVGIMCLGVLIVRYFSSPIVELLEKITLLSEGKSTEKSISTNTKELQILSNAIFDLYDKINLQSKKIKKSKERISLILKSSNDGIWDWDIQQSSVYFSDHWKEIFG